MKTRDQRKAELMAIAHSPDGHAMLLLECLQSVGRFDGIDDSCPAMIDAILTCEYPSAPPADPVD
jgi:hypothetical protein